MMRSKYLSLVALAAAAMATACSGDQLATDAEQQPTEPQTVTLTASIGSDNITRVGMKRNGGTASFYWHANDQITVQTQNKTNSDKFGQTVFTIADGTETGATTATFKGTVDEGYKVSGYALYPYHWRHVLFFETEENIYYLPTAYTYEKVESNIFPKNGNYPINSTNMPMLGIISDGKITFKHLGGLLVIRIDKMPADNGKIIVSTEQYLIGDFVIQDMTGDNPKIVTNNTSTGGNSVTFNYSGATAGSAGVFYLPVPTGDYTNLKVDVDGKTAIYGSLNVNRGDVITIPVYQGTDGTSYSCDYVVNGHKFIDLCLPSGTLWAETNVGAEAAADYGNYYAWGETETKDDYRWLSYKHGTSSTDLIKYNSTDGKTVLDNEDDAAYMNWGSFCRMPTNDEFTELSNYCSWEETTMPNSANTSIKGVKVTSKKNGNSIFLPASGFRYYINNPQVYWGSDIYYWSSSLAPRDSGSDRAYGLYYHNNGHFYGDDNYGRYDGFTIRPVAKTYSAVPGGSTAPDMSTSGFDTTWE